MVIIETLGPMLMSFITGGALLSFIQHFWPSKKESTQMQLDEFKTIRDESEEMRKELRGEINELRDKVKLVQSEVDEWRTKYFKLLQEHSELQVKYTKLKAEFDRLKRTLQTSK